MELEAKLITRRDNAPRWMVTFADLMALLFALFVLLLSFSEIDSDSFRKNAGPISEAFNTKQILQPKMTVNVPLSTETITLEEQKKLDEVYQREEERTRFIENLENIMTEEIEKEMVQLVIQEGSVIIRFPDKSAFPSGSMTLTEEILPTLERIANTLTRSKGIILVSGHTDNQPIATSQFRSNWDLSTERAVSVVHQLLKGKQIDPNRVIAQGFGDSRPLAANDTPKNRSVNRRVEITIEMDDAKGAAAAEKPKGKW